MHVLAAWGWTGQDQTLCSALPVKALDEGFALARRAHCMHVLSRGVSRGVLLQLVGRMMRVAHRGEGHFALHGQARDVIGGPELPHMKALLRAAQSM